tara:strand:- start:234 stop:410 length:177 start_codon:yes stop_codon:yes gene_type:complete
MRKVMVPVYQQGTEGESTAVEAAAHDILSRILGKREKKLLNSSLFDVNQISRSEDLIA